MSQTIENTPENHLRKAEETTMDNNSIVAEVPVDATPKPSDDDPAIIQAVPKTSPKVEAAESGTENTEKEPEKLNTKHSYRAKAWECLDKNKLTNFPRPAFGRIPNFKGADAAAARLADLEEFKSAQAIEVNPDRALEAVRLLCLTSDKTLYVPVPQLKEGLLKKLVWDETKVKNQKQLVTRYGMDNYGEPVNFDDDEKIHIDMIVAGSVAVSTSGRRIGKGKGYADLEYAILKEMKAIDDSTVIVTIAHDSQVFDDIPAELFTKCDVPVDYILTPTRTIKVEQRLPRPAGIFWDVLTQKRIGRIPILSKIKEIHESEGKDTTLSSAPESPERPPRTTNNDNDGNTAAGGVRRRPFYRRRYYGRRQNNKKSEDEENAEERNGENNGTEEGGAGSSSEQKQGGKQQQQQQGKPRPRTGRFQRKRVKAANKDDENSTTNDQEGGSADKENKEKDGAATTNGKKPAAGDRNKRPYGSGSGGGAPFKRTSNRNRLQFDFSLMVSNIEKNVRIRQLKDALIERNIKPNDITWRGYKGFCYLHYAKPKTAGGGARQQSKRSGEKTDAESAQPLATALDDNKNDDDVNNKTENQVVGEAKPSPRQPDSDVKIDDSSDVDNKEPSATDKDADDVQQKEISRAAFKVDDVIEILKTLKLTADSTACLDVKVMEPPITRIETADVTAV